MKKFFIPCLLILCMFFSVASVKAYPELNEHPNVAVMPFKHKAAITKEIAALLAQNTSTIGDASRVSEFLIKSLIHTKRFSIIEREDSLQVSNEHSYNQSGMVDTSNAAQIGKQKSVHYLITGSLSGVSTKESGASGSADGPAKVNVNTGVTKKTVVADIIFRIVNVETGEIVLSVDGRGESSRADAKLTINSKGEEVYETDTTDSGGTTPNVTEGTKTTLSTYTVQIGSEKFSLVQVENAIKKAVSDAVKNKNYGLLAELDGTAKGERF